MDAAGVAGVAGVRRLQARQLPTNQTGLIRDGTYPDCQIAGSASFLLLSILPSFSVPAHITCIGLLTPQ